jgi:transcriptional regulator with XRE-family HTH domain
MRKNNIKGWGFMHKTKLPGLKPTRKMMKLTTRELAERSGVSGSTINEIENNKRVGTRWRTAEALAYGLGVPVWRLVRPSSNGASRSEAEAIFQKMRLFDDRTLKEFYREALEEMVRRHLLPPQPKP